VFIAAVLLIGPSFVLLFSFQSRRLLSAGQQAMLPAVAPGGRTDQPATGHRQQPPPAGQPGPASRAAVLGTIAIAALIRRLRRR
jgi:hypothetical protein